MTKSLVLGLLALLALSGPAQAATLVTVSPEPLTRVDERYLSLALDIALLLGGEWWEGSEPLNLEKFKIYDFAKMLGPAYLRIGGTDADKVWYDLSPHPVTSPPPGYQLVLTAKRWDEIMDFAKHNSFRVVFTLNAGPGPRNASGVWQPDNATELVAHATQRGDPVDVWELGNEVNGYPVLHGMTVSGEQLGRDFISARKMLAEQGSPAKLAGPASAYWPGIEEPFPVLPDSLKTGGRALDIVSWHYYPQQSRRCPIATRPAGLTSLLRPAALDTVGHIAQEVWRQTQMHAVTVPVWLGETGHAQCGGEPGISDRFVSSLWWLDQLGLLATKGTKVQIRQALIGGDYGLMSQKDSSTRPDFYASMLWKHNMGPLVLQASHTGPDTLRSYAHCRPDSKGWSLLLINLDNEPEPVRFAEPFQSASIQQLTSDRLDSERNYPKPVFTPSPGQYLHHGPRHRMPFAEAILSEPQYVLPPHSASFIQFNSPVLKGCQP